MIILPKEYILAKFKQYAGRVTPKGINWNGACPICHEGRHWNEKKRLFYLTQGNFMYCHNCSESWTPLNWIKEVSGLDYSQIIKEIESEGYDCFEQDENDDIIPTRIVEDLPKSSIDLTNPRQLEFYQNHSVVKHCLRLIKDRRMDTALNSCPKYFVSLEDFKYRNRVIIPYYNEENKIHFYTGRSLYKNQTPKYLNKYGEKEVFNLHRIDPAFPYIFVFEGQIDSMFIKNGVAISGTSLTDYQAQLFAKNFPDHEIIWMLDNPKLDNTSKKLIRERAKTDPTFRCFTYPGTFELHKDFNLYAVANKTDSIDPEYVLNHSKKGNSLLLSI